MATDTCARPSPRLAARSHTDSEASSALLDPLVDNDVATPATRGSSDVDVPAIPSVPLSFRNIRMMHLLERIAAEFNKAGVPLMALKGAALYLTLYEQPDERPMADLDLMVRPGDIDKALPLLEGIGGLRGEPLVREDFFPRFHYEVEYTVGTVYPVKIDVHVRPFRPLRYSQSVPGDALWDEAGPVSIGRSTILVPSVEGMLIHLAAHAAIHGCTRGKWLEDIKRWIDRHEARIDWDGVLAKALSWNLTLPVREGLSRVRREHGMVCPPEVSVRLSRLRVGWRDRLALWQAPRDAGHPGAHVAVNVLCTPGRRFRLAYLVAVLMPDKAHMGDWYHRRHWGWLPCAHVLRWLGPIVSRLPRAERLFSRVEVGPSAIHGVGVFATRDAGRGEVIAHFHGKKVQRDGIYVAWHTDASGCKQRYEITGKLKHLNHSCRPNAQLSGFALVARRPIRAGEEITIEYEGATCSCTKDGDDRRRPVLDSQDLEVDSGAETLPERVAGPVQAQVLGLADAGPSEEIARCAKAKST